VNDPKLALAGLLVGLLVGLTGMGGGSLLTPILVLLFGFDPAIAIGTDILHGAVFKSFGAIRQRTLGSVHARLTFWMLLGSGPMSLAGVALASWLANRYGDGVQSVQAQVLGVALILGGISFLIRAVLSRKRVSDLPFLLTNRDRIIAFCIGFAGGFIVGLTSVGSGTFFGLMMLLVFPLTARKIVGTDIFHAAALLWIAGAGHLFAGNVDLTAMGWLLLGSIPGVLVASQFTVRLPDRALRIALATVLTASGIKLANVPFSDALMIASLVGGALLAVVVEVRRLNGRVAAVRAR
jgi:uncharacterized membrane protein YfcA